MALTLIATVMIGYGVESTTWFTSGAAEHSEFEVGLRSARMCTSGECRTVGLGEVDSHAVARTGLAVALSGVLAALLLLAAAGRALVRSSRLAWLPRLALGGAIFSLAVGVAFMWMAPWTGSMGPGLAAILFFVGVSLAGATAAVPLGGVRPAGASPSP